MRRLTLFLLAWLGAAAAPALAQTDYASRLTEGDVILRDFRFGSRRDACPSCASIMRRSARRGATRRAGSSMR